MNDLDNTEAASPTARPALRVFSLRWPDGREEVASGVTAAAAALSLGYGFDDFRDITWEEHRLAQA